MELFNLFGSSKITGKRTFTISQVKQGNKIIKKFEGGVFMSKNPSSAAKKALSSVCKQANKKTGCTYTITLREKSVNKEFTYKCQRIKLKKPTTVVINGKKIVYKYETKVKKV
jgi:hypothetical protein